MVGNTHSLTTIRLQVINLFLTTVSLEQLLHNHCIVALINKITLTLTPCLMVAPSTSITLAIVRERTRLCFDVSLLLLQHQCVFDSAASWIGLHIQ